MDYMKGSSGESLPMQQQQQQTQQQQQKLKKKSKNKKKSSRTETATMGTATTAASSTVTVKDVDIKADSCDVQEGSGIAINGLSDQLKQQLHLDDSMEVSSSNNASKVNGLVSEKHVNTNACPNKTKTNDSLEKSSEKLQKPSPALNGHHPEEESKASDLNEVTQASIKKTKRKPNNKKNPPTTDNSAATKENGHCPSKQNSANPASETVKEHLHNGFSHDNKEENIQQQQLSPTTINRELVSQVDDNKTAMTPANTLAKEQNTPKTQDKEESAKSLEVVESTSLENPLVDLDLSNVHIEYKEYESELQMHDIMRLIQAELSEPYSIYTYRYFIYNWPKLCFLAAHGNEYVGAIVCKLGMHMNVRRGYIAMLAVRKEYRKLKIGTTLVQKAIEAMLADKADEVVLETEMSNLPALRLYENLGFVRDKRLFRYYLNGVDALRLKLWFR